MRYASVCSGIEAASVAWSTLGWEPVWFSEIEKFPCAVLKERFINVPNLGDMTKIKGNEYGTIDILVGGTPCQDLSIAGKRMGFAGKRSVLAIDFVRLAYESGAKFFAWENVPGVFSSNGGEDFAQLLSLFAGWQVDTPADGWRSFGIVEQSPGCFGLAWRVIDVQYARVDGFPNAIPQRRNRVFVVGYIGDWRRAAQVLFEPEGLLGNSPPRREAGKGTASCAERGVIGSIDYENNAHGRDDATGPLLKGSPTGGGRPLPAVVFDARGNGDGVTCPTVTGDHAGRPTDYTPVVLASGQANAEVIRDGSAAALTCLHETQIVTVADVIHGDKQCNGKGWSDDGTAYTLDTMATQGVAVAFERRFVRTTGGQPSLGLNPVLRADSNTGDGAPCVAYAFNGDQSAKTRSMGESKELSPTLREGGVTHVSKCSTVRRLTPIECERLMGFPDDWTRIPWRGKPAEDCPDGPRYKACGNSMGVNVMRWIGIRIQEVVDSMKIPLDTKAH